MTNDIAVVSVLWICYNVYAVTPSSRREVMAMELLFTFFVSILAGVISYYICKWLDGDD